MALRGRIAASMLSVVAISGGVSTLVGGYLLHQHLSEQALNRVEQDLNAAREFYSQRLEVMAVALRYTSLGERFSQAVGAEDFAYLTTRLDSVRSEAELDVLYVTDSSGRVVYRAHRPDASGDSVAGDRLVGSVLKGGGPTSGTMLVPLEALRREGAALADRASIRVSPMPRAGPTGTSALDAGMMLCCAAPVRSPDGRLLGVLRAGVLLNGDYTLVDQVQNTVFRNERYRGKLAGTATIFQRDVRVSTNVLRDDGTRAVGSRVSKEVCQHVLEQGRTWLGRAWVVNDWYVAAYAPIHDVDGRAAGMLYVGVVERTFRAATVRTLTIFGLVTVTGLLAAGVVAWKLADSIARPVRGLASASAAIARGDPGQALPVASADEIGSLTEAFNQMARSLRERDELLKEQTRQQLTRSERLASIGRLAAGVAHEINNPLTGVLTFAHLLLRDAPEHSRERKDLETILEAATRCQQIVRGLLDFSRQSQPQKTLSDLNGVLRRALVFTRNQATIHRVKIAEKLDETVPSLVLDPGQIEQVAVNVIVNAIDAMPDGGDLGMCSRAVERNGSQWAEFEIADTGCGIPAADLERVLDPFYTTKPTGQGTGLGLAVSYGIVSEHGGHIDIASEPGTGTTVTVRLPVTPEGPRDEHESTYPGD